MGGGISTIVDLAILSHTISVEVTLYDGVGGWNSAIYCAAFPFPTGGNSDFNWNSYTTVSRWPSHGGAGAYVLPDITVDANGQPIQPETSYRVRCGIDPWGVGSSYLHTDVRTPAVPYMCETGVKVNGMEAPKVLMAGQETLTLSGVEWSKFHPSMTGMHAYEVPTPVPAMSTIEMKCCGGEECEFFFALYNCVACTGPKHGGLAETLLLDDWEAGACSPRFEDGFPTTAFHKNVHALSGEVVMTYTAGHDEIMAMFGLEGSIAQPWCVKPHGPSAPGVGCGARCPTL